MGSNGPGNPGGRGVKNLAIRRGGGGGVDFFWNNLLQPGRNRCWLLNYQPPLIQEGVGSVMHQTLAVCTLSSHNVVIWLTNQSLEERDITCDSTIQRIAVVSPGTL